MEGYPYRWIGKNFTEAHGKIKRSKIRAQTWNNGPLMINFSEI